MTTPILIDGASCISAQEAARLSGFTRDYIGKLCRDGKIAGKQINGRWYVSKDAFSAFLLAHEYEKTHRGQVLAAERIREYRGIHEKPAVLERKSDFPRKSALLGRVDEGDGQQQYQVAGDRVRAKLRAAVAIGAAGSRAVAVQLSQAPSGITDASLQLATHTPIHAITPIAELIQRTIALVVALTVTFGGFAVIAGLHIGSVPSMQLASPVPVLREGAMMLSQGASVGYENGYVTVEITEVSPLGAK